MYLLGENKFPATWLSVTPYSLNNESVQASFRLKTHRNSDTSEVNMARMSKLRFDPLQIITQDAYNLEVEPPK